MWTLKTFPSDEFRECPQNNTMTEIDAWNRLLVKLPYEQDRKYNENTIIKPFTKINSCSMCSGLLTPPSTTSVSTPNAKNKHYYEQYDHIMSKTNKDIVLRILNSPTVPICPTNRTSSTRTSLSLVVPFIQSVHSFSRTNSSRDWHHVCMLFSLSPISTCTSLFSPPCCVCANIVRV